MLEGELYESNWFGQYGSYKAADRGQLNKLDIYETLFLMDNGMLSLGPTTRAALVRAATSRRKEFLQLYAVNEADSAKIEAYLRRLAETESSESIHAYRSDLSGKLRYGVIFGDYPDRAAAIAAIKKLPEWVQASKVYPRQVKRLR